MDDLLRARTAGGHESNWFQSIPGKSRSSLIRLFSPGQEWFDKTWVPGDFVLVEELAKGRDLHRHFGRRLSIKPTSSKCLLPAQSSHLTVLVKF